MLPSQDLGKLAGGYEKYLPCHLKMLTRAIGAKETESPDFLSLLMFEPHYLRELIALGEADVTARVMHSLDTQLGAISAEVGATTADLVRAQDEITVQQATLRRRPGAHDQRGPALPFAVPL